MLMGKLTNVQWPCSSSQTVNVDETREFLAMAITSHEKTSFSYGFSYGFDGDSLSHPPAVTPRRCPGSTRSEKRGERGSRGGPGLIKNGEIP